jgi:hypothetical protein
MIKHPEVSVSESLATVGMHSEDIVRLEKMGGKP